MAFPNAVFSGRSIALAVQSGATPVPLTIAQLSLWASVSPIIPVAFGGTGVGGTLLTGLQSAVPFGSSAETVNFGQTGFLQSDTIPVQNAPTVQAVIATFIATDPTQALIIADGLSGNIDRTFVWVVATGPVGAPTGVWAYAQNARITGITYDFAIKQEGRLSFSIVPRGNQYGISTAP